MCINYNVYVCILYNIVGIPSACKLMGEGGRGGRSTVIVRRRRRTTTSMAERRGEALCGWVWDGYGYGYGVIVLTKLIKLVNTTSYLLLSSIVLISIIYYIKN